MSKSQRVGHIMKLIWLIQSLDQSLVLNLNLNRVQNQDQDQNLSQNLVPNQNQNLNQNKYQNPNLNLNQNLNHDLHQKMNIPKAILKIDPQNHKDVKEDHKQLGEEQKYNILAVHNLDLRLKDLQKYKK